MSVDLYNYHSTTYCTQEAVFKRHTKQHNSNDSYIYSLHKKEIKQMNALKDRIIALTETLTQSSEVTNHHCRPDMCQSVCLNNNF